LLRIQTIQIIHLRKFMLVWARGRMHFS
jgi:hypothetical protein